MNTQIHLLTLFVDNQFGVLTRITAMIRREGCNISTLTVAETDDTHISRITIHLEERASRSISALSARLGRLDCVHSVACYSPATQLCRGLLLARVPAAQAEALVAHSGTYAYRILSQGEKDLLLEFSGDALELDAFTRCLVQLGAYAITHTGLTTMELETVTSGQDEEQML